MSEPVAIAERRHGQFLAGDASFFLDIVRVVACEMIVVCHIVTFYLFTRDIAYEDHVQLWNFNGFLASTAVILFFLVSGIVIANSLFSKMSRGGYGFGGYFIDRFSRIYSGLVPCLAIIFLADVLIMLVNGRFYDYLSPSFGSAGLPAGIFLGSLAMLQSMPPLYLHQPPFAEPLWTLNIEWWLYMLFGWAVTHVRPFLRFDIKSIVVLALLLCFPAYNLLSRTDGRGMVAMAWLFGAVIAVVLARGMLTREMRKYFKYLFAAVLVLAAMESYYLCSNGMDYYDFFNELLIGCLMLLLVVGYNGRDIVRSPRVKSAIKTMARFSFTLYLLNMVVIGMMYACDDAFGNRLPFVAQLVIGMLLANAIAFLVARPTEMKYKQLAAWIKAKTAELKLRRPAAADVMIRPR